MTRCEECDDALWVPLANQSDLAGPKVRPCSLCLPEGYEKWKRGGFRPKWVTRQGREEVGEHAALTMAKTLADARRVLETK